MALIGKTVSVFREKGALGFAGAFLRKLAYLADGSVVYFYFTVFKKGRFAFDNRQYDYFYHRYCTTWKNERAIEVPIVMAEVEKRSGKRILEVGNVLSHYFNFPHDVIDKYEKGAGVKNVDVVEFKPPGKYDLIVSISTIEHVGFDETPKDPEKIVRALENLKSMLAPGGVLVSTLPLGYNPNMDSLLKSGRLAFDDRFCLRKAGPCKWVQAAEDIIGASEYDYAATSANGLFVGVIGKLKQ
ncbi:MAG: methyltransferase domain-containing protein [Deltaproteobacteria bacterium]|nr:methyltransferase domain-containing protein [Deltaproteobacteria bacterium]